MISFTFRTLSLIAAWAALPATIALKAGHIHRECVLESKTMAGFNEQFGRRLDDPSFWAMVATAIAVTLINLDIRLGEFQPQNPQPNL
jgi:hypothetical protein